jgi:tetratricopeptide (TPR) repeat protein
VNDIKELESYFPEPQAEPNILITSRFDQPGFNPIPLNPLNEDLSLLMLTQEAGRNPEGELEWEAARKIANALGGLPLALELAGAYLRHRPIRWEQYNELLTKNLKAALPAKMASFTRHEADLYSTLKMSERLWEEEPLLKEIIDLLTWSGPAAMGPELMSSLLDLADPTELTGALGLGQALHILQKSQERESYILHRLVQEVRRVEVPLEDRREWAMDKCTRLAGWFQEKRKDFAFLSIFEAEIDHLRAWQSHAISFDQVLASRLIWLQAYPPYYRGLYEEVKMLLDLAMELLNKAGGGDSELEATLNSDLGFILGALGDLRESLSCCQKALDIRRELFGEWHRETAVSLLNLGRTLGKLGRYEEELEYYEKTLEIRKKILGTRDKEIGQSLNEIGIAYGHLGNYQEQLKYYWEALEISKEVSGEEHPNTATGLNNIGVAYSNMGDHQEGLKYFEKALKIRKEILGDRHPDIAYSLNNIGLAYRDIGKLGMALEFVNLGLRIRKEVLGELYPDTIDSVDNLASLLYRTNRKQQAYQILNHILQKLPKDHSRHEKIKNHKEQMLASGVPGFRTSSHGKKSKKKR